jgi:hypothetical protein
VLWEFDLNELCRWGTLHRKDDWDKITQKIYSGGSLWRAGLDVARSIKKAMAILPKLDVKVVNLGKNLQVLGYASGKKFENFI